MAAPLEGPLPPNWNTAVASTGCIYYYNLLTNEVTWERPIFTPYQPIYTDMPLIPEYQQVSPAPNTQRVERAPSQDSHPKRPLQEAAPNPDLSSKRPRRKAQPLVGDTFYTYPELVARCRKMLSIEVVNSFSKFSKAISKDTFKKHAERMTSTLVEKEMRESCYKEGRMRRMTSDLRSKIRQFVEHYARRLLEKKLEYEKSLQA
ncbi:histone methyltransferase set2 [Massospora cicadina]|nr:histone methyltransferase set2 [Massospora cicadina]